MTAKRKIVSQNEGINRYCIFFFQRSVTYTSYDKEKTTYKSMI